MAADLPRSADANLRRRVPDDRRLLRHRHGDGALDAQGATTGRAECGWSLSRVGYICQQRFIRTRLPSQASSWTD